MERPEAVNPNAGNHAINCQSARAPEHLLFIIFPHPWPQHTLQKHTKHETWEKKTKGMTAIYHKIRTEKIKGISVLYHKSKQTKQKNQPMTCLSQEREENEKGGFPPDPNASSWFSHDQGMQIQDRRDFNTAIRSAQILLHLSWDLHEEYVWYFRGTENRRPEGTLSIRRR